MHVISGMHDAAALEAIAPDWPYLTEELHLTDSQADIFDRGEQVVGLFRSRRCEPTSELLAPTFG